MVSRLPKITSGALFQCVSFTLMAAAFAIASRDASGVIPYATKPDDHFFLRCLPFAGPCANMTYEPYQHLLAVIRMAEVVLAAVIAAKRASDPLARMLAGALIGLSLNNYFDYYPTDTAAFYIFGFINYAGQGFGTMQLIRFAAAHQRQNVERVRSAIYHLAPLLFAWLVACGFGTMVLMLRPFLPRPVAFHLYQSFWAGYVIGGLAAAAAAFIGVRCSPRRHRQRAVWVAVAFAAFGAGIAVHGISLLWIGDRSWEPIADNTMQLAVPLALTWVITRHRLLDMEVVRLRMTRGAIVAAIVAIIMASAHVFGGDMEVALLNLRDRAIADYGALIFIALFFRSIDRRADETAMRWFFPAREKYLRGLDELERDAPLLSDSADILKRLKRALQRDAATLSVEIYTGDQLFSAPVGELAARLQNHPRAARTVHLHGTARIFPMYARGRLAGIVRCERAEGTDDPEEVAAVQRAVAACGLAYSLSERPAGVLFEPAPPFIR